MDPDLTYVRRHKDVLFTVSCRFSRNRRSRDLQAGIQDCRMNPIGAEFCFRPLGNPQFAEYLSVVPPQLSNAPQQRTIVYPAFAGSRIIVLPGNLSRASSLNLRERLPPCRKGAVVALGRNS